MSTLEEKLRTAIHETAGEIPPDHRPPLRLRLRAPRRFGTLRHRGLQRRPAWAAPLAAAVAVSAVIGGLFAASDLIPGGIAKPSAASPPWSYTGLPATWAGYLHDGGFGIRTAATGSLLMTINSHELATSTPDGRTFVFGQPPAGRFLGSGAARAKRLSQQQQEPIKFTVVKVTPTGSIHVSPLSLPSKLTEAEDPSIALSPNGEGLAVAYGPFRSQKSAVVQVITLATGHVRQWTWPHASWTPVLAGVGAWSAEGGTLAFKQWVYSTKVLTAPRMFLLDPTAPGGKKSIKQVTLDLPAGYQLPTMTLPMITPNGQAFIAPVEAGSVKTQWQGCIAEFVARTGALTSTRAPWTEPGHVAVTLKYNLGQVVAWTDYSGSKLTVLQPQSPTEKQGPTEILGQVWPGGVFTKTGTLVPGTTSGYQALQAALRAGSGVTW